MWTSPFPSFPFEVMLRAMHKLPPATYFSSACSAINETILFSFSSCSFKSLGGGRKGEEGSPVNALGSRLPGE